MASRVVLAMSGGVDSSVAAHLLKQQGFEVIGLFMRTGAHAQDDQRRARTCCSVADALDAQAVADRLDIPFYALDFETDFRRIMDRFADEYLDGRTPNPCVLCNVWLKFGKLWAYGRQVGADHVATGHYARIVTGHDGHARIARAVDPEKDQSYVLSGLKREVLPHILLPVGEMRKAEIRTLARELGLPVHDKPDSQEICFIPDDDYLGFVRARRPGRDTSGAIVDESGIELGRHQGIEGYTIGQRKGLGIAVGEPRYVVQIEPASRAVTIGPKSALDRSGLEASRFNWQGDAPDRSLACAAQIRARHRPASGVVERLAGDRVRFWFDEPQPAVTPGQVVALYQGSTVLGGGWIDRGLMPEDRIDQTSRESPTW
jgi:tRNA-specific 2-thiouridylase